MFRRLATIACSLALVVALCVAAMHQHEAGSSTNAADSAACMYCSGGMTAAVAPEIVPAAQRVWIAAELPAHRAPELTRRLPIAHSGNAPPV